MYISDGIFVSVLGCGDKTSLIAGVLNNYLPCIDDQYCGWETLMSRASTLTESWVCRNVLCTSDTCNSSDLHRNAGTNKKRDMPVVLTPIHRPPL